MSYKNCTAPACSIYMLCGTGAPFSHDTAHPRALSPAGNTITKKTHARSYRTEITAGGWYCKRGDSSYLQHLSTDYLHCRYVESSCRHGSCSRLDKMWKALLGEPASNSGSALSLTLQNVVILSFHVLQPSSYSLVCH